MGLLPDLYEDGKVVADDITVFTSICMYWSGFLSKYVAMMDALEHHELSDVAIGIYMVGGLTAGISANWLLRLLILFL